MTPSAAWRELGLAACDDPAKVRGAYAELLRAMDPDADPDGFARLRVARDIALADTRRRTAKPPTTNHAIIETDDTTAWPTPAAPWLYAAPRLNCQDVPDQICLGTDAVPTREPTAPRAASGPAEAKLVMRGRPYAAPVLALVGAGDVIADGTRNAALQQILADAEPIEPLDADQERRAREHLAALLRMDTEWPIERSRMFEDWLAQTLAQAWPRSAPLLAPASEAFGWDSQHGKLRERPAIDFLNARLLGLRFVAEVEQPRHRLNKAWIALSQGGSGRRTRWVKNKDIAALLSAIRRNFPEIEQYLNAERVTVWDRKLRGGYRMNPRTFGFLWTVVVLLAMPALAILIERAVDSPPVPIAQIGQNRLSSSDAMDIATKAWFGPEIHFIDLARIAPLVAQMASANANGTTGNQDAYLAMRAAVFASLHQSASSTDNASMRAIARLRLEVADLAARKGPIACFDFIARDTLDDDVELGENQIAEARRLLTRLAQAKRLNVVPAHPAQPVMISGRVVDRLGADTHLAKEDIVKALQRQGADEAQCDVRRALLREALRLTPQEGNPILRNQ